MLQKKELNEGGMGKNGAPPQAPVVQSSRPFVARHIGTYLSFYKGDSVNGSLIFACLKETVLVGSSVKKRSDRILTPLWLLGLKVSEKVEVKRLRCFGWCLPPHELLEVKSDQFLSRTIEKHQTNTNVHGVKIETGSGLRNGRLGPKRDS